MRLPDLALKVYVAVMMILIVAPIVLVLISSFGDGNYIQFPPQGFSLKHYVEAVNEPWFLKALRISALTALASASISILLGAPAAIALTRYEFRGRRAIQTVLMSPLMVPALVIGITLLYFYSSLHVRQSIFTLIAGHVVITLPFAVRLLMVSLLGMDPRLEQAATSLGASPLKAFVTITLPNMSAGATAAFAFAAIMSFDDIGLALFIAPSQGQTLPVAIFTYLDQNYDPKIMAVASFTILVSLAVVLVLERLVGVSRVFMNAQAR